MSDFSYEVSVRGVEARRGTSGKVVSYRLTWKVSKKIWRKTFETRSQADSYRASLLTATRQGEAFLTTNGLPLSRAPRTSDLTWYEFTLAYAAMKWPTLSPGSRRGVAEALTDGTEALMTQAERPARDDLRSALRWAYSTRIRDEPAPPQQLRPAIDWLSTHTVRMDAFSEPATRSRLVREILTRITHTKTGTKAAPTTATRKRMILHNAMEYACEVGILTDNPLTHIRWTRPRTTTGVDPRVVINADQARRFLAAVQADGRRGRQLKAFFACMYYAALRPEEATELRRSSLTLPAEPGRWGEMRLTEARPRSGSSWTNTGEIRERVPLKHRSDGEARRVPIHPDLVEILRTHIDAFGPGDPDGRLFVGAHSGPVTDRTYLRVFHRARTAAFTADEAASPLMEVPYALRHAAVSTWLRTTGDAALVARWAGHSVAVLLKVYAKAVDGAEQESLDRIWAATRRHGEETVPGNE
jgi:integrase